MPTESLTPDYASMLKRLRADRANLFAGTTTEAEIRRLEQDLFVKLPQSYFEFLREFDGGEFGFARMHCVTPDGAGSLDMRLEFENFFRTYPMLAARKLLPFATTYTGATICFDMLDAKPGKEPALIRHEPGTDPQIYFDSLPEWLAWYFSECFDGEPELGIFLACRTHFDDVPLPSAQAELLEVDPEEMVGKSFLNDAPSHQYRLRFNPEEVMGEREIAELSKYVEDILKMTGESLEIFAYSNQEMSSDPQWAHHVGTIKALDYEFKLNAGDHWRLDRGDYRLETDPKAVLFPRKRLPNSVVYDRHRCSFCQRGQSQVRKLIAGPSVFICEECVRLCSAIVEEEFVG